MVYVLGVAADIPYFELYFQAWCHLLPVEVFASVLYLEEQIDLSASELHYSSAGVPPLQRDHAKEQSILWKAISLFVSTELAYKPWLKVLLVGLVWEKNTIQAMDYKPDMSE